jgi:hypothetical protein
MNLNIDVKIIAKTFPTIVFVAGLVLLLGSCNFGLGFGAGVLGCVLMLFGIGLFVLVLYLNRD